MLDRPIDSLPTRRALLVLAVCLLLLLAWDASSLDLAAMQAVGSPTGFALREAWVTKQLIHEGGRLISYAAMALIVAANVTPRVLPALTRRERRWWLLVTLASLACISLLKRASMTSCPWDLQAFGGMAEYVSHWRLGVRDGGPGHCFPSGHASAAFAYLAGSWALARAYPRAARTWLVAVIVLGGVYGVGQMLRGAHYPSHTLWTGWLCAAVTVASQRWLQPRSSAPGA